MSDRNSIEHFMRIEIKLFVSFNNDILLSDHTALCSPSYCTYLGALRPAVATDMFFSRLPVSMNQHLIVVGGLHRSQTNAETQKRT